MIVTEYDILSDVWEAGLTVRVNKAIAKGWQPHGAPFCQSGVMYQAVVKYADESYQWRAE